MKKRWILWLIAAACALLFLYACLPFRYEKEYAEEFQQKGLAHFAPLAEMLLEDFAVWPDQERDHNIYATIWKDGQATKIRRLGDQKDIPVENGEEILAHLTALYGAPLTVISMKEDYIAFHTEHGTEAVIWKKGPLPPTYYISNPGPEEYFLYPLGDGWYYGWVYAR